MKECNSVNYFFLASTKLFTNPAKAIIVVKIIKDTRIDALESLLSMAAFSGITRPISIKKVSKTAMCAITLFSFFNPLFIASKITPKITGISNNSNLIAIPNQAVQFVPNILITVVQKIANAIVIID